jgi:hypothetical protein
MPQIVEDGVSGRLVEPENVGALSEALASIDPTWGLQAPLKVAELGIDAHGRQLRLICEDLLN